MERSRVLDDRRAALLATAAALGALTPWPALVLPAGLLGLALAALCRAPRSATFGLGLAAAFGALLQVAAPAPTPPDALGAATTRVEAAWAERLAALEAATAPPPPVGGDFRWMEQRVAALGEGAGLAELAGAHRAPLAWRGWTTPLSPEERTRLAERLARGDRTLLMLRRGLAVRMVYVQRVPAAGERRWLAAELPLPTEPALGPLGRDLAPTVLAQVRWEALGEGVRAAVGGGGGGSEGSPYWSMLPLMGPGAQVAGRVSLGVGSAASLVRHRESDRRAATGVGLGLALLVAAAGGTFPRWLRALALLGARVALFGAPELLGLDSAATGPPRAGWGALWDAPAAWPAALATFADSPVDIALDGLLLLGIVGLALPAVATATARARLAATTLGALLFAGGTALARSATGAATLDGGALLLVGDVAPSRLAWTIGLTAPVVAGLWLLHAAARRHTGRVPRLALLGAAAALVAALQVAAVPQATRRDAEERLLPALQQRHATWEAALRDTLELAAPPRAADDLVPERDAIDLWWNAPLARLRLASGVWKFDAEGRLLDQFVTGLPPVQPLPRLAAVDPATAPDETRAMLGPEPVLLRFLGGQSALLVAEMARAEGGSWVVAVLDDPRNLSGLGVSLPTAATRADSTGSASHALPRPAVALFDRAGRLIAADLDASPPSPGPSPPRPRWRSAELGGRPAQLLEIPDRDGTVTLAFLRPGWLVGLALAVDRAAALLLLAGLATLAAAVARDPRAFGRRSLAALRVTATQFRVQAALFLVVVGLMPLLALGIAGRAVADRQARLQLDNEAARTAYVAGRLVEDFLALGAAVPDTLDQSAAAWLARSVGEDLFAWRDGELVASNRPDLVRAGLWPQRLRGEDWEALARGRVPFLLDQQLARQAGLGEGAAIVHGAFRGTGGGGGALSIPLTRTGRRIEEGLADVDRAILASAALLVLLAGWLVSAATRRLVRPLAELEAATSRIAGGDFSAPVPRGGFEETRALGRAFRSMAEALAVERRTLEERQAAIETLIARMPLAVLAVAADGRVTAANPRAVELLGVAAGEPLPDGDGEPLRAALRRAAAPGPERAENVERPGAAGPRQFRVGGLELPGLAAGPSARLVVVEDLTDAVRFERLAAWAEMARRIAHEIKNPLTPISLVVDHVRSLRARGDARFPEVLDRALGTIADQVRVLKDTAREFSDYARLLTARPEPLDLAARLTEWLAPYTLAPPPGVVVEVVAVGDLPEFEGDPRLLRRALVNLVDNALAAVADGGRVEIGWGLRPDGTALEIFVADSGPGIGPAQLATLFETGATTRETGSGLGLPIAQQAAAAHGGRIEVDPGPGRGARFTIVLPLAGIGGKKDAPRSGGVE